MTVIRALYDKWRHLVHELAKFGIVGVVAYAVDFGLSNWLHLGLGIGPITAKTVSTVIATVVSYLGNRHWSFAHRARSGAGRELAGFTMINVIGLVITLSCVALARYGLGLKGGLAFNISGNLIGTGLATVFRFWAYKKFVFLHPEVAAARGLGGAVPASTRVPTSPTGADPRPVPDGHQPVRPGSPRAADARTPGPCSDRRQSAG